MRNGTKRRSGIAAAAALVAGGASAIALMGPAPRADALQAASGEWTIDPVHSTCLFRIKHAGGATNFYGMFRDISATFTLDEENPASSSFNVTIQAQSVDTGNENRDNHVRSPDFFNVRQFPEISFTSASVEAVGQDMYRVVGNLTLHGVTKEVEAMVRMTGEGEFRGTRRLGVEAALEFKRSDFGMTMFMASDGSDDGPLGNAVGVIVSLEGTPA